MEVLTAFVREQSRKDRKQRLEFLNASQQNADAPIFDKNPPADIQAALTVIGRRKWAEQEKPHQCIDLSYSFLKGADLSGANLRRAILIDTNLIGANLESADLTRAYLHKAKLNHAFLNETRLIEANLSEADLSNAKLDFAELQKAGLSEAKLIYASLCQTNLTETETHLSGADLSNALLFEADFTNAIFASDSFISTHRAILIGVRLLDAKGLTWEQLSEAVIGETTELPPELEERRKVEQSKKAAAPNQ